MSTGSLAPKKIIETKHAELAFNYIRKHGQQEADIWYYQFPPNPENTWVVEFKGEKYYSRQALRLANLYALKEAGAIKDEEPPFTIAYREHVSGTWLEYVEMDRIWDSIGFAPRRN